MTRSQACAALFALMLAGCAPRSTMPADTPPAPPVPQPSAPQPSAPPAVERKADAGETPAARIQRGRVSHYGKAFAGRTTASGEPFDPEAMTMAHPRLPFGTRVRVTNLENQRSVEVVVNDRGPFVAGRIADVSSAAARALGMLTDGVVDAVIEILSPPMR